ncbi:hypothetical protein CTAM01_14393 [Colletotrichum tamarilloi]|uniref:Secreted protein n=1 Tax=Colletotrichum tamarilloi TaxID=1209934 RepID=A0ABQ9QPC7_9PEZI|nr:uncharacterized protein CTAM01_14393 [Colletotrichum tamarilloi]KAK1480451.1 hypothetical protein CTAM01_14393 [Colletotrichum tamarilloi]
MVLRPIFPLLLALLTQTLCVCACLFLAGKTRKIRHSVSDQDSHLSHSLVLTPPLRPISGHISRLFLVPAHPLDHSHCSRGLGRLISLNSGHVLQVAVCLPVTLSFRNREGLRNTPQTTTLFSILGLIPTNSPTAGLLNSLFEKANSEKEGYE